FLDPEDVTPLPNAIKAIEKADLIVISPGSLFTSIMPNLIIPHIDEALRQADAKIVYVCNVMTQNGETTGFTASDHVQAIINHVGNEVIDAVVVNNKTIDPEIQHVYANENAEPVVYDIDRLLELGLEIIEGDIIDDTRTTIRHDTNKIAKLLFSLIQK